MFDFQDNASRLEKCYTSIGQLPVYVDSKQPPTKRSPFSTVLDHPFVHTVEVILPETVYSTIEKSLRSSIPKLQYARLFMPLSSLLEGDFFNTYIKSGNILMISEGRSGTDNVFTLREGVLRLELGREVYERTGLTGKPVQSGGRKHGKERYLIEIDLRQPSMLHGKKGFERIVWAFKNVLNHSIAWLFYDLESDTNGIAQGNKPINNYQPQIVDCNPVRATHHNVLTPAFQEMTVTETTPQEDLHDECGSLSEWLAMISIESPRVSADDHVDLYLCRYSVPDADSAKPSNLASLKWHGFASSKWIMQLFLVLLRETSKIGTEPAWFALISNTLGKEAVEGKDGYTILALPAPAVSDSHVASSGATDGTDDTAQSKKNKNFICWEFVGASVT